METSFRHFTALGLLLIISGVIFLTFPFLTRYLKEVEGLPWILIWIYKRNGFYFITSPIIIIISIISLVFHLLNSNT